MKYGVYKNLRGGWSIVFPNGETCGNWGTPAEVHRVAQMNGYDFDENVGSEFDCTIRLSLKTRGFLSDKAMRLHLTLEEYIKNILENYAKDNALEVSK